MIRREGCRHRVVRRFLHYPARMSRGGDEAVVSPKNQRGREDEKIYTHNRYTFIFIDKLIYVIYVLKHFYNYVHEIFMIKFKVYIYLVIKNK